MGAVHPPNHGGKGQKFQTAALPQVASVSQTKLHHGPSCAPNPNIVYIYIYLHWFAKNEKKKSRKLGLSLSDTVGQHFNRLWGVAVGLSPPYAVMGSVVTRLHHSLYASNVSMHKLAYALQLHKANLSQHRKTERNATNLQERTNKSWKRYSTIFLFSPGLSQVVTA